MRINEVEKLVKMKLKNEPTGHDYLHALRVQKNAECIMKDYDVDQELIAVSCLIHDLIDHKLDLKFTLSLETLYKHLLKFGYNEPFIKNCFSIIQNISYSKHVTPSTIEGKIVQDADRLDALGAIGIARTFAYGGKKNRLIYGDPDKQDSVSHFYDKLLKLENLMNTPEGLKLAKDRTDFMKNYLKELNTEI